MVSGTSDKRPDAPQRNSSSRSAKSDAESSDVHKTKATTRTHVVGRANLHARNLSYGKLHKPKAVKRDSIVSPSGSPPTPDIDVVNRVTSESKLHRNVSATALKKSGSQVGLKRNKSTADVKRPVKSTLHLKRSQSHVRANKAAAKNAVHFDLGSGGDDDADGDGWTEASGSASPVLSRSASQKGQDSGRSSTNNPASASNTVPQSPTPSTPQVAPRASIPDAHVITARLLNRVPSQVTGPKISDVLVTTTGDHTSPATSFGLGTPTPTTSSTGKNTLISRFVTEGQTQSSGSNNDGSRSVKFKDADDVSIDSTRKVKSMANLVRPQMDSDVNTDEHPFSPRARNGAGRMQPGNSRVEQKLLLQRQSSIAKSPVIRAIQHNLSVNGFPSLTANLPPMIGHGMDDLKADPRVEAQLNNTGAEYLVVRRYQDPVGRALKRLVKLPGNEKLKRIPSAKGPGRETWGPDRTGLSQSMREGNRGHLARDAETASLRGVGSNRADGAGSSEGSTAVGAEEDRLTSLLKSLWGRGPEVTVCQS